MRHPLDAIASLRVGIARNWGHYPRPPDWQAWQSRPLIAQCAHHWAYLNSTGFAAVAGIATVGRFEDMIADPTAFARTVMAAIGCDDPDRAAPVAAWCARVRDRNDAQFVEAQTSRSYSRPDHAVRVGRWRENLSAEDVALARPIVAEAARGFGYAVPETPAP